MVKDLGTDHSTLPEQDPVTITVVDIQQRISGMKNWTAPGPDGGRTFQTRMFRTRTFRTRTLQTGFFSG